MAEKALNNTRKLNPKPETPKEGLNYSGALGLGFRVWA